MVPSSDPRLACHCRYHEPLPGQEDGFDDGDRKLMADVADRGWHLVLIPDSRRSLGWVFSVGMWHTLRIPDLALFGLPHDRASLLNDIGERIRAGGSLSLSEPVEGLLTSGLPLAIRTIDATWYAPMFGYATWFYRRPPLPMLQVVWPDPDGRFLWDDDADAGYASSQPRLWLPTFQHQMGGWSGLLAPEPWPFADPEDALVVTTRRISHAGAPILSVYHEEDGTWQFIDDGPTEAGDVALVHLVHVAGSHPEIATLSDLPRGWMASRVAPAGPWTRHAMEEA